MNNGLDSIVSLYLIFSTTILQSIKSNVKYRNFKMRYEHDEHRNESCEHNRCKTKERYENSEHQNEFCDGKRYKTKDASVIKIPLLDIKDKQRIKLRHKLCERIGFAANDFSSRCINNFSRINKSYKQKPCIQDLTLFTLLVNLNKSIYLVEDKHVELALFANIGGEDAHTEFKQLALSANVHGIYNKIPFLYKVSRDIFDGYITHDYQEMMIFYLGKLININLPKFISACSRLDSKININDQKGHETNNFLQHYKSESKILFGVNDIGTIYGIPVLDGYIDKLKETIEILELKVKKLEQLVKLKDAKISNLSNKLQTAGIQ